MTVRSPRASTTERPMPSNLATMPSGPPQLPTHVPSAPYPSSAPPQPSPYAPPPSYTPGYAPGYANQATVLPHSHPQNAYAPMPSPYAYAPQLHQPIQVVVQNQIQAPPVGYPAPYGMPAYPPVPYVRRKDPGTAVLLSAFVPGGGQLYNGQVGKGLAIIFAQIVNFFLLFIGIGVLTGLATWIWGMIDAHGSAERINRGELVP
jgi:TM2 domain-containing membrane protein YozV